MLGLFLVLNAAAVAAILYVLNRYTKLRRGEIRDEMLFYRDLLDQVQDSILVLEPKEPYGVREANRSSREKLGYAREELLKLQAGHIMDRQEADELLAGVAVLKEPDRGLTAETTLRSRQGNRLPVEMQIRQVRLRGGKALLAIARDLTERKQMENRIRHMAYYDDLTGLPNRRMFRERLESAMKQARDAGHSLAVLYIDIDRFKLVNDSLGHDSGDMLLLQVAERFTRCVGEEDFLARTEGDEYALYHAHVDGGKLHERAERVVAVLEEPFAMGDIQLHVTVSIGIALYSGEELAAEVLMKHADIALSRSKESGKNHYQIFNEGMNIVSLNRLTLESELRKAIQRSEFRLVYQPQLDTESGAVVGTEALIRWEHPERGVISPMDFIPIAEETGLIVPIGEWVIREACKQNKAWQESGLPAVPVSVNLSMRQFLQVNLKERIASILEETGLPPQYLELEITESMTMDVEFATGVLRELKELGVQISIDDFGTGYSSLYFLKKFPIDRLKIDRSFVRDIMEDPNDAAIVATIISMTRHLNLKVIAEGVETEEQLDFLHRNRCNEVQGYWFSPPVHAERIPVLLYGDPGRKAARGAV